MAFWQEFAEEFGEIGADPVGMYRYEVGHVLHVLPGDVGEIAPTDLMGALQLFNHLHRRG